MLLQRSLRAGSLTRGCPLGPGSMDDSAVAASRAYLRFRSHLVWQVTHSAWLTPMSMAMIVIAHKGATG